jgi:hypothetical protein
MTSVFPEAMRLLELRQDEDEDGVGRKFFAAVESVVYDGFSPCPWNDYLKCIPQNAESVDKLLDESQMFMQGTRDIPERKQEQAGGKHKTTKSRKPRKQKGGDVISSFIEELKVANRLGTNVQKEVDKAYDKTQEERLKAAAAIAYISRLFVLGKEDNVDQLRDHYRRKPYEMELDDVMYKLVSYIKNTRPE